MTTVKLDSNFSEVLKMDSVAMAEELLGKSHSEFDKEDVMSALALSGAVNKKKTDYLKELGDTHFGIGWKDFKSLISEYGFVEGLSYDIKHEKYTDEAIIYYHPQKALILWANSYCEDRINEINLYGQLLSKEEVMYKEVESEWKNYKSIVLTDYLKSAIDALNGCSHGALMDIEKGIYFSYDGRSALINKIEQIASHWNFAKVWNTKPFLWFVDYVENKEPDFDYVSITKEKILKCPKEMQDICAIYLNS